MTFVPPALPVIPGITDTNIPGGFSASAEPMAPIPSANTANVSDAVYTQTAATVAAAAAATQTAPDATAATEEPKKPRAKVAPSKRKVSGENTAAGAGAQASKFELPEMLAIRVEKLNAENPNDERLLLLRAMQMTEVGFDTIDNVLGHTAGATSDYIGTEAAPSVGARKMYGAVMLAMGTLYQARLLPGATENHQSLILMSMRTHSLESMVATLQDELVARQSAQNAAPVVAQAQQAYAQGMATPQFQPAPAAMAPTNVFPQHQQVAAVPQFAPQPMIQPSSGALPGQPHQFMPPQQMAAPQPQAPTQLTYEQWAAMQAQAQQPQAQQAQWQGAHGVQHGAANAYPPGFTPPFPG